MIRTKFSLAFTALIILSFLNWHCTKIDSTNIGSGLIPAVDNVNTFDTIVNVVANNIDSVPKGCITIYPTDDHALGYIGNDPYFGTTTATIYTELKPANFPFSFQALPSERTLDSVVLVLAYKRTFGDSTIPQTVSVQEIAGPSFFKPDSSSCSSYPVSTVLGSKTYIPQRLRDTLKVFGDTAATPIQLRIRLNNSFGQDLLARDTFKTDTLFMKYFKGFAIVPSLTGNALTYYGITDPNTKLAIYYKYKRANLADTTVVTYFRLYSGDRSANQIVRNRANSEIANISRPPASNGDNFVYIQTSPGSYAELKIPALDIMSNRIIHRAELIIDQAPPIRPLDSIMTPPPFLFLDLRDSLRPIPCDFSMAGGQPDIGTFGGFKTTARDAFGNTITRYSFNISRYVQKVLTHSHTNSILRLHAPTYVSNSKNYVDNCGQGFPPFIFSLNYPAYGRVKLVGGTATGTAVNRMRLRIIYSKL